MSRRVELARLVAIGVITLAIVLRKFIRKHASTTGRDHAPTMRAQSRCIRGFVTSDLLRTLRTELGATGLEGLSRADRRLITTEPDPAAWIEQAPILRLAAAAREQICEGRWSRLRELFAGSLVQIHGLGYRAVLHYDDPEQTFAALSVLWRASFNYGRAIADTDDHGATIHVIDGGASDEIEGNLHAGWCLGVAWLIGLDEARLELRRRPWADVSNEQVMRLDWPARRSSASRPRPCALLSRETLGSI